MTLVLGLVSDLHFGPEATFEGKLRKLSHRAPELAREVVRIMNEDVKPDLFVNLGDDVEDESIDADLARYAECQSILRGANAELVNVAGNHDTIHVTRADLERLWQRNGALHYSFDRAGYHFVVLHTFERKDVEVRVPRAQIEWLEEDLRLTALETVVFVHHPLDEQDFADSRWFHGRAHLALAVERAEVRRVLEERGNVRAVFNGHVHRNHCSVIGGIPYVTLQSLIENLDDDAPGRAASTYAVATIDDARVAISVRGHDPARYEIRR